jgi:hypothetical protein
MAEPRLIEEYHTVLRTELPRLLADEVSDGLAEAYDKYLLDGLDTDAAARAAVAEFGDPRSVVAAFSRASPASRAARALVVSGPVVGLCWAAALITGRAWNWPVPVIIPVLLGSLLAASVAALVTAARARRYRAVCRSGAAGCLGLAVLDTSMIVVVIAAAPGIRWLAGLAICASAIRLISLARARWRLTT